MAIQKTKSVMTGFFSQPFGGGKYTTFSSNGCQYFIALEQNQQIPVDLEIRAVFECEHKTIVETNKNGVSSPAGILRPSRFIGQEKEQNK
jgi:hypothetical protein